MTELPRKAVARTARLAALPLGYAGRNALGLGKRLSGRNADVVMTEIQQRTAEQLFRTLGELKGGAMKFGQAMSVLEAALPDELGAPYRAELTRLQDSAPTMPTQTVRDQIAADLGEDWLIAELQARANDELDYTLEAEAQRAFAQAYRGDPEIVVPDVVAVGEHVLVTEWLESPASLASVIERGTQEERDHYGELFVRFLFSGPPRTGMLHADPHPGNFRIIPDDDGRPGRLGVLDFGAVARLPDRGLPEAMGRLIRIAGDREPDELLAGLRDEGFIKPGVDLDPRLVLDYLAPFVEPTLVDRFRFSREWMQGQFQRINNPKEPTYTVPMKLNLPPSYLLIHRTWLGGIGVLSQLGAEAPFRAILEENLPGFAD